METPVEVLIIQRPNNHIFLHLLISLNMSSQAHSSKALSIFPRGAPKRSGPGACMMAACVRLEAFKTLAHKALG
eukprot:5138057-Amphidinium_carterae.1